LQKLIHEDNSIGLVHRVFADFGLDMPLEKQPEGSRLSDLSLGAGSLLDIGVYSLTWAHLALHDPEDDEEDVTVAAALTFNDDGVDEIANVILNYTSKDAQAVCTSTYLSKTDPEFCRIEGSKGSIHVLGRTASKPSSLLVKRKGEEMQRYDFAVEGWGFFYEQDAVAKAIKAGQKESEIMTWAESLRVLGVLDEVRRLGGLKYPQDEE
jgi:predicted dehydrogenase